MLRIEIDNYQLRNFPIVLLRKLTRITELANWLLVVLRKETAQVSGLILSLFKAFPFFFFWSGKVNNSKFQEQKWRPRIQVVPVLLINCLCDLGKVLGLLGLC